MKIVGLDPGSRNFAATTMVIDPKDPRKFRVTSTQMIAKTLYTLRADARNQLVRHVREVRALYRDHEYLTAERFMARGKSLSGSTGETVNMMIGGLLLVANGIKTQVISSALWKNAVKRRFKIELLYRVCQCPPHIVDSAMIALFTAYQQTSVKPFSDFRPEDCARLCAQLHRRYKGRLRSIRQLESFTTELKESFRDPEDRVVRRSRN